MNKAAFMKKMTQSAGRAVRASMIALSVAAATMCLEVKLEQDAESEDIPPQMWALCEVARDLWAEKLGFDACYGGDTVTVKLCLVNSQDKPKWPFMFTNALPASFSGSRTLASDGVTTITFKDRAYVNKGPDYKWNEDAPWLFDPDPLTNALWTGCDLESGPCRAPGMTGKIFDFFTHILHEFGHVFGFVGGYFEPFVQTTEDGVYFQTRGADGDLVRFALASNVNKSHAATSIMVVGFSSWERALPNREEIQALKAVFGYEGIRIYRSQAAISPGQAFEAGFTVDTDELVADIEVCHQYQEGNFASAEHVNAVLVSPAGTEVRLGAVMPGWVRDGYVRPELTGMRSSRNPLDPLFSFRDEPAEGVWKIRYSNSGAQALTLDSIALRIATMPRPSTKQPSRHGLRLKQDRSHTTQSACAMFDLRGRRLPGAPDLHNVAFMPAVDYEGLTIVRAQSRLR